MLRQNICLILIITFSILSPSYGKQGKNETLAWDDDDCYGSWSYCYDVDELSTGAIIGIAIAGIVFLLIIICVPIILCYCCAWCCFKQIQRSNQVPQQVVIAAPTAQYQYPVQSPQTGYSQNPPYPVYRTSNGASPPYPVSANHTLYPSKPTAIDPINGYGRT